MATLPSRLPNAPATGRRPRRLFGARRFQKNAEAAAGRLPRLRGAAAPLSVTDASDGAAEDGEFNPGAGAGSVTDGASERPLAPSLPQSASSGSSGGSALRALGPSLAEQQRALGQPLGPPAASRPGSRQGTNGPDFGTPVGLDVVDATMQLMDLISRCRSSEPAAAQDCGVRHPPRRPQRQSLQPIAPRRLNKDLMNSITKASANLEYTQHLESQRRQTRNRARGLVSTAASEACSRVAMLERERQQRDTEEREEAKRRAAAAAVAEAEAVAADAVAVDAAAAEVGSAVDARAASERCARPAPLLSLKSGELEAVVWSTAIARDEALEVMRDQVYETYFAALADGSLTERLQMAQAEIYPHNSPSPTEDAIAAATPFALTLFPPPYGRSESSRSVEADVDPGATQAALAHFTAAAAAESSLHIALGGCPSSGFNSSLVRSCASPLDEQARGSPWQPDVQEAAGQACSGQGFEEDYLAWAAEWAADADATLSQVQEEAEAEAEAQAEAGEVFRNIRGQAVGAISPDTLPSVARGTPSSAASHGQFEAATTFGVGAVACCLGALSPDTTASIDRSSVTSGLQDSFPECTGGGDDVSNVASSIAAPLSCVALAAQDGLLAAADATWDGFSESAALERRRLSMPVSTVEAVSDALESTGALAEHTAHRIAEELCLEGGGLAASHGAILTERDTPSTCEAGAAEDARHEECEDEEEDDAVRLPGSTSQADHAVLAEAVATSGLADASIADDVIVGEEGRRAAERLCDPALLPVTPETSFTVDGGASSRAESPLWQICQVPRPAAPHSAQQPGAVASGPSSPDLTNEDVRAADMEVETVRCRLGQPVGAQRCHFAASHAGASPPCAGEQLVRALCDSAAVLSMATPETVEAGSHSGSSRASPSAMDVEACCEEDSVATRFTRCLCEEMTGPGDGKASPDVLTVASVTPPPMQV